ncbi:MAG: InlB B-repeat-containing protein [Tannerella sp.]|jgi:uncharacterized repeat protein (TIGR02543 family)/uncharacterized repeat protein (TIGR01451 family)|nr:InlB B-repeat-containing protein [Tannerella sp.]
MKKKILIITGVLFSILFPCRATLVIDMGSAILQGRYYTYPDATVTGNAADKGYVIRFMFTHKVTKDDEINFPSLPAGLPGNWQIHPSSMQNARVVAAPDDKSGATAAQLQAFLRQVQVKFDTRKEGQAIMVLISDNFSEAGQNIYYSPDTKHYYEFVENKSNSKTTWESAYNAALKKRFMGLKGYLATVTSEEEQIFLVSIIKRKNAWIGGTRARLTFNADSTVLSSVTDEKTGKYWYWASGPEFNDNGRDPIKSVFYRKITSNGSEDNSVHIKYPYINWKNGEPNNLGNEEGMLHINDDDKGTWNDNKDFITVPHHIVEYSEGKLQGPSCLATVGFNCTKIADTGSGTSAAPVPAYYGDNISYTIHATNASEDSTAVTVTDVVPAGLTVDLSSISNGGSYNSANRTVTWNLKLAVDNGKMDVSFKAAPANASLTDPATLQVNNSATVSCISRGNTILKNTNSTYHQIKRARVTFTVDEPDAADLTAPLNPVTVDYGRTLGAANVNVNATAKPGYRFNSWSYPAYTDLKSISRSGDKDVDYTNFTVYGNMTVTANFDTILYKIIYNDGGSHTNPTEYHVKTPGITLTSPTRKGYHFDKWTDSAGKTVTGIPAGSTGDITLVAHWTEITANPVVSDTICTGVAHPDIIFSSALSFVDSFKWSVSNAGKTLLGLSDTSGTVLKGDPLKFALAFNNTVSPVTDTITVIPKKNANSGTPVKFGITVNPMPQVDVIRNDTVFNGDTVLTKRFSTLIQGAKPNVSYTWTSTGDGIGLTHTNGIDTVRQFVAVNNGHKPLTDTITVTPHIGSCSGRTEKFTITVNPMPQVNPTPNDTVCNGAVTDRVIFSSPVTGATQICYKWENLHRRTGFPKDGEGNINPQTLTNSTSALLPDSIIVTPYFKGFENRPGPTDTFLVMVNPTPQMNKISNDTVCNGMKTDKVIFSSPVTGATPMCYKWENLHQRTGFPKNGEGDINPQTLTNSANIPLLDSIVVTPYFKGFENCPGMKDTFFVVVNPSPAVIVPADTTVCNNSPVGIKTFRTNATNTTVNYKWKVTGYDKLGLNFSAGEGDHIAFGNAINSNNSPRTDTVTVTPQITGFTGCPGQTNTFLITVNPTPTVRPPADTVVYDRTSVGIKTFSTDVRGVTVNYKWKVTNHAQLGVTNTSTGSGRGNSILFSNNATNSGNSPRTDTVTVTPYITGFENYPGPTDTFLITVLPSPAVILPSDTIVCNNSSVGIKTFGTTVTGATVDYEWEVTNHNRLGLTSNVGQGDRIVFGNATNSSNSPQTDTVTVTPKIGNYKGPAKTFTITVNPMPTVTLPADTTVCNNSSVGTKTFGTTLTGVTVDYEWKVANHVQLGLTGTNTGNGNSIMFSGNATNGGNSPRTDIVTVTPYITGFKNYPGPTDTFRITVNPVPTVILPSDTMVCNNSSVGTKIFGTTVTGATVDYEWKATNHALLGLKDGTDTGNRIVFGNATNSGNSPRTDTVTVTPYIAGFKSCPGPTDTFRITVNPGATVYAISDTVYYDGQSVAALTAASPTIPAADVTFSWTNSNPSIGLSASGTGPAIPAFTASVPPTAGSNTATVTVTPKYKGCTGTDGSFKIIVRPKPVITYDYNGGTAPASPNPANYVVGVGCTVSNDPTRAGYIFQGWSCAELGISSPQKIITVPATANVNLTLKAEWGSSIPYNITYHNLGGATVLPPNPGTYNINTSFTLTAPSKKDTVFIGWTGTDITGPFPQLNVTVPAGKTGDRTYTAHWGFLFPMDTMYKCKSPATLQSGHDGQSYEWTLPDGSTQTTADIQATVTGKYILATNYGANSIITKNQVFVLLSSDSKSKIECISTTPAKAGLPQTFTVPLHSGVVAAADEITWNWSFPGGNPATLTNTMKGTLDTASVVYNSVGPKTVSVRVRTKRGSELCEETYTYSFEIYPRIRGFFVNRNVTGGKGDGSSWPNAFRTLQEALAHATEGDYVWVARGNYRPATGSPFVMKHDSVEIYGGFAATETYLYERNFAANATILRGNGNSVIYTEGVSNASRWDGFIIEGGDAVHGGGMLNRNSSVSIANNIIRSNSADNGGGIFNEGGNPVLYNVEISGNTAVEGGAMYNIYSSPRLTNVTVSGNYASTEGGGLYNYSGSHPVLRNTIVWGNRSVSVPDIRNDGSSVPNIASSLVGESRTGGKWNIATGTDGGNNFDTSPSFRKQGFDSNGRMQQGNYQLYGFSTAVDRGVNRYVLDIPIRWNVHLQTLRDTETVSAGIGKDLAGNDRIQNTTIDMGAYEHIPAEYNRPNIKREVFIPEVEGATTVPLSGLHYVQSHSNFVFTITPRPNHSLDSLSVKTGIPLRDKEGVILEHNEDGSVTVIILQVTEPLRLTITGITQPVANEEAMETKVWSYGNHLYVQTCKDTEMRIHTSTGALCKHLQIEAGNTAVILPQGIYAVTLNGKIYKVVIR